MSISKKFLRYIAVLIFDCNVNADDDEKQQHKLLIYSQQKLYCKKAVLRQLLLLTDYPIKPDLRRQQK